MSDDLDDIKRLLAENAPPKASAEQRARATGAAMAAFDAAEDTADIALAEKNSARAQETKDQPRQRVRPSRLMTLYRRLKMTLTIPSTRSMMLGGASVATLVVAVMAFQASQVQPPLYQSGGTGGLMDMMSGPAEKPTPVDPNAPSVMDQVLAEPELAAQPAPAPVAAPQAAGPSRAKAAPQQATRPSALSSNGVRTEDRARPAIGRISGNAQPLAESDANLLETAIGHVPVVPNAGDSGRDRMLSEQNERIRVLREQVQALESAAPSNPQAAERVIEMKQRLIQMEEAYKAQQGRDQFEAFTPNPVQVTAEDPVSTLSVDVDTASYSFVRQALMRGVLPQKNAVRIEELINYFPYDYAVPDTRDVPFASDVTVMPTPWNDQTQLMRIGIQGYELEQAEKPKSNLVFLIDTSGSMNAPEKLPLLIRSFQMMVDGLDADDTVSIVVYAGSAGTVLPPTKVANRETILAALNRLSAGGSTAGGEGIRQAYALAEQNFDKDGINRVILATDGDFNVGIQNTEELKSYIERKRDTGVFLSVLGFGRGNYNDALMQALAQNGNGNAAYIDTEAEARKVLVEEASSTLFPIAKDVKIQVEFNPAQIAEYRLIGFETRALAREDFNNDKIDAGEIGAGHSVTALYEIMPTEAETRQIDSLRYQTTQSGDAAGSVASDELAFVKIRYKAPDADESQLITRPVTSADVVEPGEDARFAAAVAAFGQLLRGGRHTGDYSYDDVVALAKRAVGDDPFGYRAQFVDLARRAAIAAAMDQQ